MANSYFDFKEFRIEQSHCANKVSTDACVFGAFVASQTIGKSILDVGTGSGLLALMLAQKSKAKITGIEIESSCTKQAKEN
ncbi:MAG: methyltransferase domain-containing protein, partial [Chitinophagales bacterium]|nr:methyltransferase domain-containing protein [Chitinophagales bacterium]